MFTPQKVQTNSWPSPGTGIGLKLPKGWDLGGGKWRLMVSVLRWLWESIGVVVVASLLQSASPAVPLFFQASRRPSHYFCNVRVRLSSVLPDYRHTYTLARAPLRILGCAELFALAKRSRLLSNYLYFQVTLG
jgi:hypothetical protein